MEIPLFPLHAVLAPGIALPLHIFEERYRVMVRRCLDASAPFGVVLIRDGREVGGPPDAEPVELAIAGIGTFAEIREASRYADGRYDILTVGAGRFVVRDVVAGREPYLVGIVEPVEDEVGDPDVAERLARRVMRRFVDYLRLIQPRTDEEVEPIDVQVEVDVEVEEEEEAEDVAAAEDEAGDDEPGEDEDEDEEEVDTGDVSLQIPDDPVRLSHLLAGILQVELERKQALLEAPTAEERLRGLDELLDREIVLLERRLAPFTPDRRQLAARAN